MSSPGTLRTAAEREQEQQQKGNRRGIVNKDCVEEDEEARNQRGQSKALTAHETQKRRRPGAVKNDLDTELLN